MNEPMQNCVTISRRYEVPLPTPEPYRHWAPDPETARYLAAGLPRLERMPSWRELVGQLAAAVIWRRS